MADVLPTNPGIQADGALPEGLLRREGQEVAVQEDELRQLVRDSLGVDALREVFRPILPTASARSRGTASGRRRDEHKVRAAIEGSGLLERLSEQLLQSYPKPGTLTAPPGGTEASQRLEALPTQGGPQTRGKENADLPQKDRARAGSGKRVPAKSKRNGSLETGAEGVAQDPRIRTGSCYLSLLMQGGRAFLGEGLAPHPETRFQVHLQFGAYRHRSALIPCQVDPAFQEDWLLELPTRDHSTLCKSLDRLHFVVTSVHAQGHESPRLVGVSRPLDWRTLLAGGRESKMVELYELSGEALTTGLLSVSMRIVHPSPQRPGMGERELQHELAKQARARTEATQYFLSRCKQWWLDFQAIRPSHAERSLKLLTKGESGERESVCSFVQPLRSRHLPSPQHAARFVALLHLDERDSPTTMGIGERRREVWASSATLLAALRGGVEEHAVLLCSLLLGFHLDAYVTFGVARTFVDHVWVTTIAPDSGEVRFWEATTGAVYKQAAPDHGFQSIGAIFNHRCFYGNVQTNDSARRSSFDLEDGGYWKALSRDAIESVARLQPVTIGPCDVGAWNARAVQVEDELRRYIEAFRQERHLACHWDEGELGHLFLQSMCVQEQQKLYGPLAESPRDFDAGIRQAIPEGHVFKAFHHQHRGPVDGQHIMQALVRVPRYRDLLALAHGDKVRFAVACRAFPYAEEVAALWVMVGVRYKETC